ASDRPAIRNSSRSRGNRLSRTESRAAGSRHRRSGKTITPTPGRVSDCRSVTGDHQEFETRVAKRILRQRQGIASSVDNHTLFSAQSMSKPVFAYVVMKLCEEGAFSLDTPLAGYTPEHLLEGGPRIELITARRLLSHKLSTSGNATLYEIAACRSVDHANDLGLPQMSRGEGSICALVEPPAA